MKTTRWTLAAMLAGLLWLPLVASAIEIDGIVFEEGSILELGELFEAENLAGDGNLNGFIDQLGEELIGVGRITSIRRGSDNTILWNDGDKDKELTVYFYGYFAEFIEQSTTSLGVSEVTIAFSGGFVELYSQDVGTWDQATGTQEDGINTATAGTLWLSLVGAPLLGIDGPVTGAPLTLLSEATGVDPLEPFASGTVSGVGRLDVVGGPAAPYLDTNQFQCLTGQGDPNCPYESDKSFESIGGLQPIGETEWAFSGNLTVRDFAVAVPEPGTMALLGLGLAGLGFAARRRVKAA